MEELAETKQLALQVFKIFYIVYAPANYKSHNSVLSSSLLGRHKKKNKSFSECE